MTIEKKLGKITVSKFGLSGYQGCQIGLEINIEMKGCGVGDFISGGWDAESIKCDKYSKWTEEDRTREYANMVRKISKLLSQAKINDVSQLVGKPVEVTFEGLTMKSWRILEEVL